MHFEFRRTPGHREGDFIGTPITSDNPFARITTATGFLLLYYDGRHLRIKSTNRKGQELNVVKTTLDEKTVAVQPVMDRHAACQLGKALGLLCERWGR